MAEQLGWDEVERAAREVFHVWTDSSCELDWAHHAWSHLARAGLASYREDSEHERCQVAARFISLCDLYCDFVYTAWQERQVVDYGEVADELEVGLDPVLELARRSAEWEEPTHSDAGDVLVAALKFLSDQERDAVVTALLDWFEGSDGLFNGLWRSHPGYHYETFDEAMKDPTTDKMAAYEWVREQRCESLRGAREAYA